MPPKPRKPAAKRNAVAATVGNSSSSVSNSQSELETPLQCDGCTDSLTKNEALNCSICNVWLHCYCAGVPRNRYSDIASSYVCIPCSLASHRTVVSELKNEIASLRAEVVVLKDALNLANKKLDAVAATQADTHKMRNSIANNRWSTVVKRGTQIRRQTTAGSETTASSHIPTRTPQTATEGEQHASSHNTQKPKVRVPGARRVWGTH